jgi:hypothetical protein
VSSRRPARLPVVDDFGIDALFTAHRMKACLETPASEAGADTLAISERAFREARHLDFLTNRWPVDVLARLEADRAAAWQDVVRDHARQFRREIASLRHALGMVESDGEALHAVKTLAVRDVASVRPAVVRLLALIAAGDLSGAYAQALWFDEPWTFPDPPGRFGIVTTSHHMSVKTP